ncbi:hypothetical protein ACWDWO_25685 [Actinopolymorpha singaporensis]
MVGHAGAEIPTLDLYRRDFVLLAGPAGQARTDAAGSVSAGLEVPVGRTVSAPT